MSMIKCPECGKEISDKAVSCPNCGYPLSQSMELASLVENGQTIKISEPTISCVGSPDRIGCPRCGSTELHAEKQGFSGKKALVGAVLTGGVGLLAGTIGSKNIKITCLKCGHSFKAGEGKAIKGVRKVTFPESFVMDEIVLQKLKEGLKYAAATEYGKIHNVEFLDATEIVETYIKTHPSCYTEKNSSAKSTNSGCATIIVVLLVVGTLLSLSLL